MQEMQIWSLGQEDSPGKWTGNLLQSYCLENAMDRRAWQTTVHGVAMNRTWLSNLHTHIRLFYIPENDTMLNQDSKRENTCSSFLSRGPFKILHLTQSKADTPAFVKMLILVRILCLKNWRMPGASLAAAEKSKPSTSRNAEVMDKSRAYLPLIHPQNNGKVFWTLEKKNDKTQFTLGLHTLNWYIHFNSFKTCLHSLFQWM